MIHPASISGGAPVAIATRKRPNTQNISHVPLIVKYTMLSTAIGSRRSPDYGSEYRRYGRRTKLVPGLSFRMSVSSRPVSRLESSAARLVIRCASSSRMRRPCSCAFVDLNEVDFRRTTSKWRLKIFRGIVDFAGTQTKRRLLKRVARCT